MTHYYNGWKISEKTNSQNDFMYAWLTTSGITMNIRYSIYQRIFYRKKNTNCTFYTDTKQYNNRFNFLISSMKKGQIIV